MLILENLIVILIVVPAIVLLDMFFIPVKYGTAKRIACTFLFTYLVIQTTRGIPNDLYVLLAACLYAGLIFLMVIVTCILTINFNIYPEGKYAPLPDKEKEKSENKK